MCVGKPKPLATWTDDIPEHICWQASGASSKLHKCVSVCVLKVWISAGKSKHTILSWRGLCSGILNNSLDLDSYKYETIFTFSIFLSWKTAHIVPTALKWLEKSGFVSSGSSFAETLTHVWTIFHLSLPINQALNKSVTLISCQGKYNTLWAWWGALVRWLVLLQFSQNKLTWSVSESNWNNTLSAMALTAQTSPEALDINQF